MPLDLALLAGTAGVVLLVSDRGALKQSITTTTTLGWDQHLAAAKAYAHRLGGGGRSRDRSGRE